MERIKTVNLKTMKNQKEFWDYYLMGAVILGIVLVMLCFFRRTVVNGKSMDSTLHHGQNLICERAEFNNNVVFDNGDIVVVESEFFQTMIIKRVIGTPGDTIEITDNVVYLNGIALNEDYLNEPMVTANIPAFILADDEYFVMGDNRNNSADSRMIGPIKAHEMYGRVIFDVEHMSKIEVPEIFTSFRE